MRSKLALDIDTLQVQSFGTAADDDGPRGTVHGHGTYVECTDLSGCCFTDWDSCQACGTDDGETCTVRCVPKE